MHAWLHAPHMHFGAAERPLLEVLLEMLKLQMQTQAIVTTVSVKITTPKTTCWASLVAAGLLEYLPVAPLAPGNDTICCFWIVLVVMAALPTFGCNSSFSQRRGLHPTLQLGPRSDLEPALYPADWINVVIQRAL